MNVRVTVWGRGGGKGGEYELGTVLLKHHFFNFSSFFLNQYILRNLFCCSFVFFCVCVFYERRVIVPMQNS